MWIVRELNEGNTLFRLPVFYKTFRVGKAVANCALDISALGIFSIKINSRQIDDYFMPGWTNYNRYVNLCSYDLTADMQEENLLEVTLSDGWYSGRLGYTKKSHVYGDVMALYCKLHLTYEDGSTEILESDETWRAGGSNILTSSLFDGEKVDFRLKDGEVNSLPFAKKYDFEIPFEPYDYEPTRKIDALCPTVLWTDGKTTRLDFKQNFAGFISFTAKGKAGTKITLRHAEVLNDDGTLYYENLRSVQATDEVILSDDEVVFAPKFTFHGFRYAEIMVDGEAEITDLKGVVLSQALDYHGEFSCSDEVMNGVYKNVLWGQKSNFISLPMDCPQRDERLGWTGDAQVFCNSAMFNADANKFFANYLKLIRTDFLPDGKVPSFVPFFIPVSVSTAGVPGWADAICVIPYTHYLHYRDISVIKENLPYAIRHIEYYLSRSEDYLLRVENPFGDWLSVVRAEDQAPISQCFLGLSAQLIVKMYAILGEKAEESKYAEIYEKAKAAFRRAYLKENGEIEGNSQTIYALSLSVGFVSAEEIKAAFVNSVKNAGWKLTTGFIGVKYLLPALCEIGETDLAYQIIKERAYPSWGYAIDNGATTIWERWNGYTKEKGFETPSMNSFNHYSLGSCAEWLYSHVLGIKLSADKPVCISPSFSKELAWAKGSYRTNAGKISLSWERIGEEYCVTVQAECAFDYDFTGREILSVERKGNTLQARLK